MVVIEAMDYIMLEIIDKDPTIPNFVEKKDNDPISITKTTKKHQYNEEYNKFFNLHFRAGVAIQHSLAYYIYHVIRKWTLAK